MAGCVLLGGNSGANPEEVTARANDVVEGKTTINDEGDVVSGQAKLLKKQNIHGIDKAIRAVHRSDEWGSGKYHWSQENGDALIIPLKLNDNKRHVLEKDVEFLFVPTPGLSSYNMVEGTNVLGLQGRIPLRRVDTDMYNVMLPYDRGDFWGKGRCATHSKTLGPGVITSIKPPNGEKAALHEDVCFVFLPEPNLLAHNIKQGVTMFGVAGTAPDYTSGRVAFNGATFDGTLLSGVAEYGAMRFNNNGVLENSIILDNDNRPLITNNGIEFKRWNTLDIYIKERYGCLFGPSINLYPFRKIKMRVKFIVHDALYYETPDTNYYRHAIFRLQLGFVPLNGSNRRAIDLYTYGYYARSNKRVDNMILREVYSEMFPTRNTWNNKVIEFTADISDLNDFYWFGITNYYDWDGSANLSKGYVVNRDVSFVIQHIEFIN